MGLTAAILEPTGVDVERIAEWVLPSGAAGGVIVAAWLVESKQRVVENMAAVLTMLFTPLFAVMLAGRLALRPIPHATQQASPARTLADHLLTRLCPVGRHGRGHPPTTVRLQLIASP